MSEALKEALRSDGTPFVVVTDADIAAGQLLTATGAPAYPIVISLANEAISSNEVTPLLNYVSAGGYLFMGGSSFTRNPDGTTLGDFALASQMGLHMAVSNLQNWYANTTFTNSSSGNQLTSHIPTGTAMWQMPLTSEDISWGTSPHPNSQSQIEPYHYIWQVTSSNATVIATGDNGLPYITTTPYGQGQFIYDAAMQPLMGVGGFAPGMYTYGIFRNAIQWAFQSANIPLAKVSPWPYPYNAAYMVRHDFEDYQGDISSIAASAQFENSLGALGEYYFCTGTLRVEMANSPSVIAGLQQAATQYGATIGAHNGGLQNPNNSSLVLSDFDYWHWGPDEALDDTIPGYNSGSAYASASMSESFSDINTWMSGYEPNVKTWAAPYFNGTREGSNQILQQLGVATTGEQKLGPFPHWTLSTQTDGLRYPALTLPLSDWILPSGACGADYCIDCGQSNCVSQSMDYYNAANVDAAVDYYYSIGALINIYMHELSSDSIPAEYIQHSASYGATMWPVNAVTLLGWWTNRSPVQIIPSYAVAGNQVTLTAAVSGATDSGTAVEFVIPNWAVNSGTLQVLLDGSPASPSSYRTFGNGIKVSVGTSVSTVQVSYNVSAAQTITVGTPAPSSAAYNSQFTVAATASSGLQVAYTSSGGCTNSDATYTMTSASTACSVIFNQAGDTNYTAAPPVTETVTATLAGQAALAVTGVPVTAQAYGTNFTVGSTGGSGTGSVTFAATGACSNTGATVTMTSGSGTCSVTATKASDSNYTSTTSAAATVGAIQATAVVTLSNLTQTYSGAPEPATVSTVPTGLTLTFSYTGINGTSYGPSTTAPTNPGSYQVAASVVDPNYIGQDIETLTINQLSPALSLALLTGMPEPSTYGYTVYFELSMATSPCPTGQVQFYVDGSASGSPVVLNGASCTSPVQFQTATLTPGPHSVYAVYSGDTYYLGDTSAPVSHGVTADSTSVTLATSGMSVNVGQPVTFTATVTPAPPASGTQPPAGTVEFLDGGLQIGTGTLSATAPFTATYTTSSLAAGPHSISANFVDSDGDYVGSSSTVAVQETVNLIVPVISWPNPADIVYGTALGSPQLNATASDGNGNPVSGTFVYAPVAGTILPVGPMNLTATFTPDDSNTYASNSASATINVNPAALTVTGLTANDKPYDGTTAATLSGTASLVGVVSGDSGKVTLAGTPLGTFASSGVGTGIAVNITGLSLTGTSAANYTLTAPASTASISPAALTVTGLTANSKTYDGTTAATLAGTASLVGVVSADSGKVTLAGTPLGTFASSGVGTGIAVNITGLSLTGISAANYTLTAPASTASISPAALTVTGLTANSKTYDGTTAATLAGTASLVGVVSGDSGKVTLAGTPLGTFASSGVGTGIAVNITGLSLTGISAANYTLTAPASTASISPAALTVTGLTANSKTYDGTTAATLAGTASLVGVVSADSGKVTLAGTPLGTFASSGVGTGIAVNITGLSLTGTSAANYTLTAPASTASISPAALTVTGLTANSKTYDGTTAATLAGTASLVGVVSGDSGKVTLAGTPAGNLCQLRRRHRHRGQYHRPVADRNQRGQLHPHRSGVDRQHQPGCVDGDRPDGQQQDL